MKIIIIGSQGFIGSHLCNYFSAKGYKVFGADIIETPANINYTYIKLSRLSSEWDDLLKQEKIDVCINAAGSGNVAYSVTHPLIDFEANTLDVIKILDAICKHQPACKYLHISSAAVYGNPESLPIKETDTLSPISPYGYHKMMSEIICKEYQHLFGLNISIVRPFSVFGNGLRKQLLWDICTKLLKADEITLFGTGNETRDFIHISDLVLLIDLIIAKSDFKADVYNAASGSETSIKFVASIFENCFGKNKKINFGGDIKKGDPLNWKAAVNKLSQIGFSPAANLEAEIINYSNWFKELSAK